MKLLTFFTTFLLVGLVCTAPTSNDDDYAVVVTENFFSESKAVYTSEHDIVNLLVPLNALNFEDDSDDEDGSSDSYIIVFFVAADTNEKGERVDQGLYMLKHGHATKLLDHGRDAAAADDDTKTAYFAAKDGIYSYNAKKIQAEKYGSLTDNFIGIAKVNGNDVIYALTDDLILYKVTEKGTKKEKIDKVVNAKQIVLDYQNNLYYYTTEKEVYALVGDEVKKIEGLPKNPTSITILKPPFVMDNGLPVIVDNTSYLVYENGTSEFGDFLFQVKPSAYAMEATLIQYYAYNKNIYGYSLLRDFFLELQSYLDDKTDSIQSIATRSRSDLRA